MTTPLQKAAQALIDNWDYPTISEYIAELRKALDAEIAQAVEPVAFMRPSIEGYDSSYRDANVVVMSKASGATHWDESGWVPLYMHPPQPQATTSMSDFDMRGVLASNLLCWKRLTESEAQDLVCFFEKVRTAQGEKP